MQYYWSKERWNSARPIPFDDFDEGPMDRDAGPKQVLAPNYLRILGLAGGVVPLAALKERQDATLLGHDGPAEPEHFRSIGGSNAARLALSSDVCLVYER